MHAAVFLKVPALAAALASLNAVLEILEKALQAGTGFVFGYLGGAEPPFAPTQSGSTFVLAFRALPLVLMVAALSALLFHWGVLPVLVRAFAWLLHRTMGIGGSVGVSAAANVFGGTPWTLERLFGLLFAPLAWLVGVPASEALTAGALLGKKTVLNESIAYLDLAQLPETALSGRSRLLLIYALCGFANFGNLGIMLGGLSALLPTERRAELVELGLKSIFAGLLATGITAAMVGVLV